MTRRRSLLLLDEEEAASQQMLTLLTRFRDWCEITVFHEGLEAQQSIEARPPDLVLMDPRLPDVNGLDLIRCILQDHPETDVIVLLPMGMETVGQKALETGAVGLLTKPYQSSRVEEVVSRCLGIQVGLRGDVDGISLSDLVQLIHSKKWDRTVVVTSGDGKVGRIFFLRGEIRHAETDLLIGIDAFNQMLDWPQGRFEIRTGCSASTRSVEIPTMQVLLDGLRRSDEGVRDSTDHSGLGEEDEIGALFESMMLDEPGGGNGSGMGEIAEAPTGERARSAPSEPPNESLPETGEDARLDQLLRRIRQRWNLADSCAVVNDVGYVIAGQIEDEVTDRFWSQLFGATAAFFDDTAQYHHRGLFREGVLKGTEGCLVVLTIPRSSCFLVATTRADARVGLILSGLESSLEELGIALQGILT